MKSGVIYIKRRLTSSDGYTRWTVVKEKPYKSVAQRKTLMVALVKRYLVNNINIVISVVPRVAEKTEK